MRCARDNTCENFVKKPECSNSQKCQISQGCKEYIQGVLNRIPEVATTEDLISIGIFTSKADACRARKLGNSPDYLQFNRKITYPKKSVEEFLYKSAHSGSMPNTKLRYVQSSF